MARIVSFRDLDVYELTRAECRSIFDLTRTFPTEERYSLVDQIRRSSRSVLSHIAEAWGRRAYPNAFAYKLDEAMGEANETQGWLDASLDCKYISVEAHQRANQAWQQIGAMLNRMIEKKESFCRRSAEQ